MVIVKVMWWWNHDNDEDDGGDECDDDACNDDDDDDSDDGDGYPISHDDNDDGDGCPVGPDDGEDGGLPGSPCGWGTAASASGPCSVWTKQSCGHSPGWRSVAGSNHSSSGTTQPASSDEGKRWTLLTDCKLLRDNFPSPLFYYLSHTVRSKGGR